MSVAASKTQIHLGGVVVINTPQLHLSKSELRFCRGLSPAHGMLAVCDGEKLRQ